jgi:hypothetical protein
MPSISILFNEQGFDVVGQCRALPETTEEKMDGRIVRTFTSAKLQENGSIEEWFSVSAEILACSA